MALFTYSLAQVRANFWQRARDRYQIIIETQFTEEEKFLVKQLGIENHVVFFVPYLDDDNFGRYAAPDDGKSGYGYPVYQFIKWQTNNFTYEHLLDAKAALPIIEQQFLALKETLNSADIPEHRTFEL
ncbi:MAG: hypothetical protein M3Z96_13305 [Pseudomonadota bacterium]|nr:hypothetical protein [Pseudomonadota bacterium]